MRHRPRPKSRWQKTIADDNMGFPWIWLTNGSMYLIYPGEYVCRAKSWRDVRVDEYCRIDKSYQLLSKLIARKTREEKGETK